MLSEQNGSVHGTIPGLRCPGDTGGSEEEKEEKDPIKARETIGRSGG